MFKGMISCALGSSLEWFDFALYGFLAPILAKIFFSHSNSEYISIISVYLIFAIGFAARPIGGFVFGHIGDKYGRSVSLIITPIGMTVSTSLMALLPSYYSFGDISILLLIALRFVQGFFLGGEFTGNIVYLSESSKKMRYLLGSLASCTGSIGILMASSVASISYYFMNESFLLATGWRLCFLLSIPIGVVTIILRMNMPESIEYNSFKKIHNYPNREIVKKVLLCTGLIGLHAVSFYFVFMYIPVFLNTIRHLHDYSALIHNTWFLLLHILCIPIFGLIVNNIGGRKGILIAAIIFIVFTPYLFYLIAVERSTLIIISLMIFSLMTAFNAAIIPGLLAEILPVGIRYRVIGISFNVAFGLFGGLTPAICLLLTKEFNGKIVPSYYIIIFALITLAVSLGLTRLRGSDGVREVHSN